MPEKGNITACFTTNLEYLNLEIGSEEMGIFDHEIEYSEPGSIEGHLEAVARQQNQVSMAILTGPVMPMFQLAKGEDPQRVIATQAAAAMEAWVVLQAIGHTAAFGEGWMAKQIVRRAMFPTQVMLGAPVIGITAAVGVHGQSTAIDKTASLGGVPTGKTQKQRMARLGGL